MEWKDLQPIATVLASVITAVIGSIITARTLFNLQDKKRNDYIDSKSLEHSLDKRFKEFEQTLIRENSYLSEKGKNDATKEDVYEINQKLESIKTEYLASIEFLRWHMTKEAMISKLQIEKEFDVYTKIWEVSFELKFAVEWLRPKLSWVTNETIWNERFNRLYESKIAFVREIERHRPFYSDDLYDKLESLNIKVSNEMAEFKSSLRVGGGAMTYEGYQIGEDNSREIRNLTNEICTLMQNRLRETSDRANRFIDLQYNKPVSTKLAEKD